MPLDAPSPACPPPLAALVVGYRPDIDVLDTLLTSLLSQVSQVILLDNGGAAQYLVRTPALRAAVTYIDMGGNAGLGAALNRGMARARAAGCRDVLTFDQDSAPPDDMATLLMAAMQRLRADGVRCAAIGPTFHDRREQCADGDIPRYPLYREVNGRIQISRPDRHAPPQPVDLLITSGMLVDSEAWSHVPYDERLFIDLTDTDWCFQLRAAGYALYAAPAVQMPHALSEAPPVRVAGLHLLRYSPLRRYYYFRNALHFLRQPYVSSAWRRRQAASLLVRLGANLWIDDQRWRGLGMSLRGLWHGVRGRLGPYPG